MQQLTRIYHQISAKATGCHRQLHTKYRLHIMGSSIKGVHNKGKGRLAQMWTRVGGLSACGRLQLSITVRLAVQLHSDSYHPTVTAVSLLNAPLKSLDICLWLLGLWHRAHASVRGEAATSHPSLRTHWPTHCFATGCMQLLQHSLSLE